MFAICPTDLDWFEFNKTTNLSNGINFWTPTPWNVRRLNEGDRLYFMLKAPVRKIGGFGQFKSYENLSIPESWNKYGYRNGCGSKEELINRLDKYLHKHTDKEAGIRTHQIGCIELDECEFWEEVQYIDLEDTPHDFNKNIVKIKYFEEYDTIRNSVLSFVSDSDKFELVDKQKKRKAYSANTVREGQSEFRARILQSYNRKCCITGDSCEELLEAAHIQPYLNRNSNHVQNGLLLRIDMHKLFDSGLLEVDSKFKVRISKLIRSEYYQSFDGKRISLPSNPNHYPSIEALTKRAINFRD